MAKRALICSAPRAAANRLPLAAGRISARQNRAHRSRYGPAEAGGNPGVGITSSVDAPGEAALLIYILRGAPQDNIPAEIDGLRTRVRETSPFTAGRRGNEPASECKVPVAKTLLTKTNP